jgi:hypothetical protein
MIQLTGNSPTCAAKVWLSGNCASGNRAIRGLGVEMSTHSNFRTFD